MCVFHSLARIYLNLLAGNGKCLAVDGRAEELLSTIHTIHTIYTIHIIHTIHTIYTIYTIELFVVVDF
jgi:hypothetical protein